MEKIYQLTYELKELMDNDSRISLLNKLEKEMNESEEVMKLSYKKDLANDGYCDSLRYFGQDSKEEKESRRCLYLAKKELEEHPLVKKYLACYQEVRLMLEEVSNNIFSIININMCEVNK